MAKEKNASDYAQYRFLTSHGKVAELILQKDWSNSSLKNIDQWSQALRTSLNISLNSQHPVLLLWSEELICFYNDAFYELLGEENKTFPGISVRELFSDIEWVSSIYKNSTSGIIKGNPFKFSFIGNKEFVYAYNPVFNEDNNIAGMYVCLNEVSEKTNSETEENAVRLRMAIQSINLGTWDYNPLTDELIWSDECRAIFAFPSDKKVDFEVFSNHIYPDDKDFVLSEINKAMQPESVGKYDIIYRILRYDDRNVRWIKATGKVFFKENKVERFIGTVIDITEQKDITRRLEESERKFKMVADTTPAMIWTSNIHRSYDFLNKGWLDYTGRSIEEELDKGWTENIHPEDLDRCMDIYNNAFDHQKKYSMEYRLRRFDGKYRWIADEGTPRYSSEGEFLGFIGACVDIQERKMAREELERKVLERTSELNKRNIELQLQKEFVDTILESSVDVIAVLDTELKYVALNRSACEMYKVTKEDLIGKKMLDVYPGIKDSGMYADLQQALTGKTIHNPKYRSTVLEKHFENFYIPLKNRNDTVYGVLLVSHDNTAIVETTIQLEQANRILEEKNLALERTNKELESFSYVASHDLQEPLRKIRTFAELIQKDLQNEKLVKKYFSKIEVSAQRMSDLIKAVLNYSRLSKTEDLYADTDLNHILKNVRSDFELLIQEKGAVIKSEKLPAIKGIPLQLNQLFSNLIGNSIKFTENKPKITISARIIDGNNMPLHPDIQPEKKYAQLIFKDNGIGFEQRYSDQIFTIFKRLHNTESYTGTGIGLALCKKIVENHRGFIAVRSEPGKGSEFCIYLPVI
jgi:PAS domain S-box-containing protein